jgi:hypothetical protein
MKDEAEELFDYIISKESTEYTLYSLFPSHCYTELSTVFSNISEVTSFLYLIDSADV